MSHYTLITLYNKNCIEPGHQKVNVATTPYKQTRAKPGAALQTPPLLIKSLAD